MKTLKEMIEDRMKELNSKMTEMEENIGYFHESSVNLQRYTKLNDEYWMLEKLLSGLEKK